jgi:hypothetical protein
MKVASDSLYNLFSSLQLLSHRALPHRPAILHEYNLYFLINLVPPHTYLLCKILLRSLNFVFIFRNTCMASCSSVQLETWWSQYNWPEDTRGSQAAGPTVNSLVPLILQYVATEIAACACCATEWEMCVWNRTVCRENCIIPVVNCLNSRCVYS